LAVGARCLYVEGGVGAVVTQAFTDPRLGPRALAEMKGGRVAQDAVDRVMEADPHSGFRQLGAIGVDGYVGAQTGASNQPWAGHLTGAGYVVLGNHLPGRQTLDAMAAAFEAVAEADLGERLMAALEAGRDRGGQIGGQQSAALLVYESQAFPWVDLRVDAHAEPVAELRRIFELYQEVKEWYATRADDPRVKPVRA
jgi:uncharacterized Ntn-hydrolase superfamily protein